MKSTLLTLLTLAQIACVASALAIPTPTATTTPVNDSQKPIDATQTPNTEEWTATVSKAVVNVRAKPGGAVIGSLRAGDSVEIVACVDKWCEIVEPSGYIWRGCLSDNPEKLKCEAR